MTAEFLVTESIDLMAFNPIDFRGLPGAGATAKEKALMPRERIKSVEAEVSQGFEIVSVREDSHVVTCVRFLDDTGVAPKSVEIERTVQVDTIGWMNATIKA